MTVTPRVSVLLPTYNRASLLPRAVASVLSQSCPDFELIIVDDHSTDDTPRVIASFDDRRIRTFRHVRNLGQSAAVNCALRCARGEYVAFLDDDDEWLPDKLIGQLALLDAAPAHVGLVYGWRADCFADGARFRPTGRTVRETMRGDLFERMLVLDLPTPPSSWLVRTCAARSVAGFDEARSVQNDLDFLARLCTRGWHVEVLPRVVFVRHEHAHVQMTDPTPAYFASASDLVCAHLDRFAEPLRTRPCARARLLLLLARYQLFSGRRCRALVSLVRALRLDPLRVLSKLVLRWRYALCFALPPRVLRL